LVDQICASSNPLISWLRQIRCFAPSRIATQLRNLRAMHNQSRSENVRLVKDGAVNASDSGRSRWWPISGSSASERLPDEDWRCAARHPANFCQEQQRRVAPDVVDHHRFEIPRAQMAVTLAA
jgi:hypothetical protein